MIPATFEYHRPADVAAAVAMLREHGDEARVVAGGHSLIPMMKLRMAQLGHLIDLRDITELRGIAVEGGTVTIGAMATQHEIITHDGLGRTAPILREAALQIADPQVRYVGTIGGNLANGDPGNDMPALMQCLDAVFTVAGPNGTREIAARDFYDGAYMTAREEDEILTRIRFTATGGGWAYEKQKRKIGDYATAAAAVVLQADGGRCTAASVAMTNLADTPVWVAEAGEALTGSACDEAAVSAAVEAMQAAIDPAEDMRGPVAFKRHVAGVILRRAIARAWSRV